MVILMLLPYIRLTPAPFTWTNSAAFEGRQYVVRVPNLYFGIQYSWGTWLVNIYVTISQFAWKCLIQHCGTLFLQKWKTIEEKGGMHLYAYMYQLMTNSHILHFDVN